MGGVSEDNNLRNYLSACNMSFHKFIGLSLLTKLMHSDWKKGNYDNNGGRLKMATFNETFFTFTINGQLQQQLNSIRMQKFCYICRK